MEITEVRIKLMEEPGERLKAFCSITFDNCFVVRDLKIIEGTSGPFVAMPSRKLTAHCPRCGMKNHLRAPFCNQCGSQLSNERMPLDSDGRAKLYADIAHPINSACREMIQEVVVEEYYQEIERAKMPDYVSRYDDFDMDYGDFKQRPQQGAPGETRVDQAHQRRHSHLGNNRPQSGGPVRERTAPPTTPNTPSAARNAYREPPTGFGAGIFPGE